MLVPYPPTLEVHTVCGFVIAGSELRNGQSPTPPLFPRVTLSSFLLRLGNIAKQLDFVVTEEYSTKPSFAHSSGIADLFVFVVMCDC